MRKPADTPIRNFRHVFNNYDPTAKVYVSSLQLTHIWDHIRAYDLEILRNDKKSNILYLYSFLLNIMHAEFLRLKILILHGRGG